MAKRYATDDVSLPAGANDHSVDQQIQSYQKQLRRLATELSLTEARERREIASDLHDHIGQALAFVTQKIRALQGNAVFSGMEDELSQILEILSQTIRYTRDLTVEISPPVLYELGLQAAIDWLKERTVTRHKLKVRLTEVGTPNEIADDVKNFIFKAIQELINNVVKHADATQIGIESTWGEDSFKIVVSDNGRGFDASQYKGGSTDSCCFGLFSIRERLSYIGGRLTIDSSPGRGTRVSITAPYSIPGNAGQ